TAVLFDAILNKMPAPPLKLRPDMPAELERTIAKALEKDREVRCQTAAELRSDLKRVKRGAAGAVSAGRSKRRLAIALGVLMLLAVSAGYYTMRAKPIDSLAVMPFVNVGGDPNAEYLSDGITENLINNLSQLPKLRVVPRTIALSYKGKDMDPRKLGQELHVR